MKRLLIGLVLLGGVLPLGAMNHNLAWPWGNPARCSNPQTPLFAFYNRVNTTMMFDSGDEIAIYCQAAVRTGSGLTWTLARNQVRQTFLSGEAEDLPANLFVIRIPTKDLTPGFYDLRVKLEGLGSAKLDLFPRVARDGTVSVQSVAPTGVCTFGWKADEMPITDYRPADFVAFWQKAYADYRARVPLDARVESVETTFDAKAVEAYNVTNACLPFCFDPKGVKYDEVVSYKVSWAGPDGGRVTAWLARPKAPGKYPAMLVLPGAGMNPRPRPLDHARHGYVAIDVHVHGRDCENPDRSRAQGFRENGEPIRFPLDQVGWYNVYLRAARGIDYLASLPFVDSARIVTVGGSQGGRLSIVVPALESRVAATVPSIAHGGNIPYLEWSERMNGNVFKEGRPKSWGYYPDPSLVKGDGRDLVGAPPVAEGEMMRSEAYFDIMNFAPEVKCPVLMSMGLVDYISFPSAVYATYLKCGSSDKTMLPVAGHGHDWFAAFDRRAYRWLEEKLPPPEEVYDLVICGSSSAGLAAAVEAKRQGLTAVVLSETSRIGGLTTGGLGQTDIGLKDAFGGISREFYRAVKAHYADPANWKWQRPEEYKPGGQSVYTRQEDAMWTFEPSAALKILEGWEKRDGLDIRRGERR